MTWTCIPIMLAALAASPAHGWQAGVDGAVCTLAHAEDHIDIRLTYDPSGPLFAITLRVDDPWPDTGTFEMHFAGSAPLSISTTRQILSDDRLSLTVTDRGFSNVLDGLQFNRIVTVGLGATSLSVPLDGAEREVASFRTCTNRPVALAPHEPDHRHFPATEARLELFVV